MLRGSIRMSSGTRKSPAASQVHASERTILSSVGRSWRAKKAITDATNETATESVEMKPATRRGIRVPASVIRSAPASGEIRQTQAAASTSAPEGREPVDVELEVPAVEGDDETEPDDDLRGRDGHHRDREDLPVAVSEPSGERDEGEVRPVEHDREREQDDERIAPQEHAQRARGEEKARHGEVERDLGTHHRPSDASSSGARRLWPPSTTPPTAATSSTIDVTSHASRWSVRNNRPISAGEPKAASMSASSDSESPAVRPSATITSTRIAAPASTPPTACHDGPPVHGEASVRSPR